MIKIIVVRLVLLLMTYGTAFVASYYSSLTLAEATTALLLGAVVSMWAEDLGY